MHYVLYQAAISSHVLFRLLYMVCPTKATLAALLKMQDTAFEPVLITAQKTADILLLARHSNNGWPLDYAMTAACGCTNRSGTTAKLREAAAVD